MLASRFGRNFAPPRGETGAGNGRPGRKRFVNHAA